MARYRDKPYIDWSADGLPCDPSWSTGGKWHYHAWVEDGTVAVDDVYGRIEPGQPSIPDLSTTRYHPEVHALELATRAIEVPEAIVKMAEGLHSLAEQIGTEDHAKYALDAFVNNLKRMLLQAYVMGLGDTTGALYYQILFELEGDDVYRLVPLFD